MKEYRRGRSSVFVSILIGTVMGCIMVFFIAFYVSTDAEEINSSESSYDTEGAYIEAGKVKKTYSDKKGSEGSAAKLKTDRVLKSGEDDAKKNIGNYSEKVTQVYEEDRDIPAFSVPLRFYSGLEDIPYIGIRDYYRIIMNNKGYLEMEETEDNVFLLTTGRGDRATVDLEKGCLYSDDLYRFTDCFYRYGYDQDSVYYDGSPFIKLAGVEYDREGSDPATLDFSKYGIKIYGDPKDIYFPLATLSDIFSNMHYMNISYIEGSIYYSAIVYYYPDIADRRLEELISKGSRGSLEAREFNYKELCFNIDNFCGHPAVSDIEPLIRESGLDRALKEYDEVSARIKNFLLSEDIAAYLAGTVLLDYYLYDGHNDLGYSFINSIYDRAGSGEDALCQEICKSYESILFDTIEGWSQRDAFEDYRIKGSRELYWINEARNKSLEGCMELNEDFVGDAYNVMGDTAVVSFSPFLLDTDAWDAYYLEGAEIPKKRDSVGIVYNALKKAGEDKNIKNFVIDISSNFGGSGDACVGIYSLITGKREVELRTRNRISGRVQTARYLVDRNFDGEFNEEDNGEQFDFNFCIITSYQTFSCGNLLTAMLKDEGIKVVGERTGGGANPVRDCVMANGMAYSISDNNVFLNAGGEGIEGGITPDFYLIKNGQEGKKDYSAFFDIKGLSKIIAMLYGSGR
ncbi:MAG: hypothetical protein K5931_03720 [Lachnospiraceae bacterium]|nr:hypothetical protein [Lachnospiraceae bacterium]